MLNFAGIDPRTLAVLRHLMACKNLHSAILAEGTGLALQLGHRLSIDIDLFSSETLNFNQVIKEASEKCSQAVKVLSQSDVVLTSNIAGIKVEIVNYPYPFLHQPIEEDGIRVADIRDIGVMKLSAIASRGSKKDFVDLHVLLEKLSLGELIRTFATKHPNVDLFHIYKSLAYFDDAESTPMPKMLIPLTWDQVKLKISETLKRENPFA